MARALVVIVIALLLAVQIVRNAAVKGLSVLHPQQAAKFWHTHPRVEIPLGLTLIGAAARNGQAIDARVFSMINDAARKAPLAPEPFLVRGVQAQMSNNTTLAKQAFAAAQWRDPRSLPAAYFLADYFFRAGQPMKGLEQTALLARLAPQGVDTVAPFVAAYAGNRGNWPQIRALFRAEPGLEQGVLVGLARNAANADAVLALADPANRRPDSIWLPILLNGLVASGDYPRAYLIWRSIGAPHAGAELVHDPGFADSIAPPPFNWTLASSTLGLAERQPAGRLHILYYGNEDGALASQLVQLPPGAYRLRLNVIGAPAHPEALSWSVRCDGTSEPIATMSIDQVAKTGFAFRVPPNCRAQWLELSGRSGDIAQQSDVTIAGFSLTRIASGA